MALGFAVPCVVRFRQATATDRSSAIVIVRCAMVSDGPVRSILSVRRVI